MTTPITVAYGDGIGPEIMEVTLHILREAGADITVETVEIGQRIYNMDSPTGILPSAWDILKRNKILLKAPVIAPEGGEQKNVSTVIMERFGLSAQIDEPVISCVNEEFSLFETTLDAMANYPDPSPMLQAAMVMLRHIGQPDVADKIERAWQMALESGIRPEKVGTEEFMLAVIQRLHIRKRA